MKKQFNRMRQLANQTVGRAEKTEVLSDDLLQIERRMELVRLVSHNTHKRLVSCLQGQLGTDNEKRHKKLPLTALSQAMEEGGGQLGDESLIGKMMDVCGEAEGRLATELMQHELQIERDILDPLNQLAEVEIPNILKQRKQLAKLVLDYDSARTRWHQAAKSSNQTMVAKADSLKDEMDEALNKVEICKDQLSADMYNFASKEGEYARYYVMLLEAQADYHRRSLAALEAAIPTIHIQQDSWMEKPAFGTALEEHLKRSNREIALPIEACVMMLLETGMKEEGLFRIAAGASKLKKLKAALDCSTSQLEEFYSDPHAVAGALKSYLRELPEPLMTFGLYDEWIQASNVSDPDKRLQALWVTCDRLPKTHKANLRYLVKFLAKLAQDSEINKMTPSNIAIVLGPNLLWAKTEGTLAEMAAATSVHVVAIIEPIIQHADWFFPEDVDFNVSGMFAMPTHPATPDLDPGLDRKRPGSLVGQDGDSHTPRKDSTVNKQPEPTPRRASAVNRKQPQLTSPTFQPPLPPLEAGGSTQPEHQFQASSPAAEAEQPGLSGAGSAGGGGGLGGGVQVATVQPQVVTQLSAEESSPARELMSTPPPQRNGSVHLTVGTPHSQGGSRGPSPHMVRRGTKKQAPAPPKQASPFASQPSLFASQPSNTQTTSSSHYPPITPRRHSSKDGPIHAPSHPPPQPPQPHQAPGDPEPSPPSTPTPPDTPPHDGIQSNPLSPYHSGSLPRPSRPAPRPRPRPSMPPPPQPSANDNGNGLCSSASKIITDV
ncbi:rho GTPase-activating protein 17b isoform X2 [Toxotes jaculatrix]|uniref:rho GTPase-activating protein 17b isoform X2 n=1 Tax=Toxotes jaculatrix TaxID=941984 RepID=UPI001B3AC083|nr:rho GTPase-activating protein 17b isoform X2 [Toxotes jaculatrix]XP_040918793.1 rho GTPase-activating protein 17b isoform X2 [Toxotes jaculatrix]XP_040918794.1 rho GTPase-activating protein 17b isoform X2 [Toxotes jaculatrix]